MKIKDGKIIEATNNELIEHWIKHWTTFYSYPEYRHLCESRGTKIVPEGENKTMTTNEFFEFIYNLYKQKNAAYGNSAHDTFEKFGIVSYIVRMTDKANRISQLTSNPSISKGDESIKDTWADLASYSILCASDLYCSVRVNMPSDERAEEYFINLANEPDWSIEEMAKAFGKYYVTDNDVAGAIYKIYNEDDCGPAVFISMACYAAIQYIKEVN